MTAHGFTTTLIVEKIPRQTRMWVVQQDLIYQNGTKTIVVQKGFHTDLTTGWFNGRNTESSVLHDWLLTHGYGRKTANRIMNEAMKASGVRPWHRKLIFAGVTAYRLFKRGT